MLVRLQCPSCGKSLVLECDAATETLVCRACGTSFDPPPDCLLPGPDEIAPEPQPVAQSTRRRRLGALPIGAVAGFAALMIGGLTVAVWPRRPAEAGQAANVPANAVPATQPTTVIYVIDRSSPTPPGSTIVTAHPPAGIHAPLPPQPAATSQSGTATEGTTKSDFDPVSPSPAPAPAQAPSAAPAGDFAPPAAAPAPASGASDFGDSPTSSAGRPAQPDLAATLAQLRGVSDAEVERAIHGGAGFLLAQFKDGELAPDGLLSDSQRQALDALCVYALVQSGQSTGDARLSARGTLLPDMLTKLRSFDLSSDGRTTNRPLTYGRSLRAAALASLDRPEDRPTLKADVAWLIGAQIHGAYTYDDLYAQLAAQGNKLVEDAPRSMRPPGPPAPPDPAPATSQPAGEFGGGSVAPPVNGGDPVEGSPRPGFSPGSYREHHCIPSRFGLMTFGGAPNLNLQGNTSGRSIAPPPQGQLPPGALPGDGRWIPPTLSDGWRVPVPKTTFTYPWDNSNSQYGLLGVWAGAEVGIEVPEQYWKDVEHHWVAWQLRDGQWSYRAHGNGYLAMNCAGIASLLVTHDYLDVPQLKGTVGRPPYNPSLSAGLAWLEAKDNSMNVPNADTHYAGYDLFGIERVGLASGYKYFGSHDWYRELAGHVVSWQFPNGSWGHEDHGVDSVVETAYMLLFLSRGRHPVMMTKLKFPGSWDNRPRDLANLAKFTGRELERQVNWQVVGIEHDWQDYFDSPVLYIASHEPPALKDADYLKLRSFVLAGGLIFTQADGSSPAFNAWVAELAKRIAPSYKLEPLPENSPIYSIQYKIASHPPMLGVSNGSRLLMVHSPVDLSLAWQERSTKTRRWAFEIGANVFIYASGKPDLRNRLDSPYLPAPPAAPEKTIRVAVLKYDGNWNPEPAAWFRMSRSLQWAGGPALDVRPMAIEDLGPGICPVATLTGTDAQAFSAAETAALRAFVEAGGTLLIDATGGENAFARSVRDTLLRAAFPDAAEQPLPADHPLFKDLKPGQANDSPMRLRPYAVERLGRLAPQVRVLTVGKGTVVFSAMDLTSGLLGTNTWGIAGYDSASAQLFVRNLIAWKRPF